MVRLRADNGIQDVNFRFMRSKFSVGASLQIRVRLRGFGHKRARLNRSQALFAQAAATARFQAGGFEFGGDAPRSVARQMPFKDRPDLFVQARFGPLVAVALTPAPSVIGVAAQPQSATQSLDRKLRLGQVSELVSQP